MNPHGYKLPGEVKVIASPHPFLQGTVDHLIPAGETLEGILQIVQADAILRKHAIISIDGHPVPRHLWKRIVPKENCFVTIGVLPEGGRGESGGKNPIRTILTIGLVAASFAFAGPLGAALLPGLAASGAVGAGIATAVGSTIILGVGGLLIDAIAPIRPTKNTADNEKESPSYFLDRARNDARPYAPIPVVLGRHKVVPPLGAEVVTEILGDDHYLRMIVIWGYGPLIVSDIKIGETLLSNYEGVEIETREGRDGDTPFTIYSNDITQVNLNVELSAKAALPTSTNTLSFSGTIAQETTRNESTGGRAVFVGTTEQLKTLRGTAQEVGSKEFTGIKIKPDGRVLVASDWRKINTYLPMSFTARDGNGNSLTVNGINTYGYFRPQNIEESKAFYTNISQGDSFTLDITIMQENPDINADMRWVTRTSGPDADELSIDIAAPRGIFRFDDKNKKQGHTVIFELEYRKVGDSDYTPVPIEQENISFDIGDNNEDGRVTLYGSEAKPRRYGIRWLTSERAQYEVRMRRISNTVLNDDGETSDKHFDEIRWAALRTITDRPPIDFPKPLAMSAIRIKATNQISGGVDQINAICQSEQLDWDGTGWTAQQSSNPAGLFRHVLQGPAREIPAEDEAIDLDNLKELHDFCDDEEFEFNAIIDYRKSVWEQLLDICAVCRSSPTWVNGKWRVIIDSGEQTPVQLFTPNNTRNFRFERGFQDVPHCLRFQFQNRDKDWRRDEYPVYDDGYAEQATSDLQAAERFSTVDLTGITDPDHVWKIGRFQLAQIKLRREKYIFDTDFEYLIAQRGSLVNINHDSIAVGTTSSRVRNVVMSGSDITAVELDDEIEFPRTTSYIIAFRTINNAKITRRISGTTGPDTSPTRLITLDSPLTGMDVGNAGVKVGTLVAIGEAGRETIEALVTSVAPTRELGARITCLPWQSPGVYQAHLGPIPPFDSKITFPVGGEFGGLQGPVLDIISVHLNQELRPLGDGTSVNGIIVQVQPINKVGAYMEAQIKRASVDDTYLPADIHYQNNSSIELGSITKGFQYDFRLRWIIPHPNNPGETLAGPWTERLAYDVQEDTDPEPDNLVSDEIAEVQTDGTVMIFLVISWDYQQVERTEVRYRELGNNQSITLKVQSQPSAGDTVRVGSATYTFGSNVSIGGSVNATARNLATVINAQPDVNASLSQNIVHIAFSTETTVGTSIQVAVSNDDAITGEGTMSYSPGDWAYLTTNGTEVRVPGVITGHTYEYEARHVIFEGFVSDWVAGLPNTIDGDLTPPGNPTNLDADGIPGGYTASWDLPTEADYGTTLVYDSLPTVTTLEDATYRAEVSGTSYTRTGVATATRLKIWVRHKDRSKNLGGVETTTTETVALEDIIRGVEQPRAPMDWYCPTARTSWSDSEANDCTEGSNVINDVVTLYNETVGSEYIEARAWDGMDWIPFIKRFDGNVIIRGTLVGDRIAAHTITADRFVPAELEQLKGVGQEETFTAYHAETLPSNRYPLNSAPYRTRHTNNGQEWSPSIPTPTDALPYVFVSRRDAPGRLRIGDLVAALWTTPVRVYNRSRPGIGGLSGYSHSILQTNFQLSASAVNSDEEWFFSGGTGSTWPATTSLILVETNAESISQFRLVESGSLLTIYRNNENWGDYVVNSTPTVTDAGRVTFSSLSLDRSEGSPSFSLGSNGDIHFNPKGEPGEDGVQNLELVLYRLQLLTEDAPDAPTTGASVDFRTTPPTRMAPTGWTIGFPTSWNPQTHRVYCTGALASGYSNEVWMSADGNFSDPFICDDPTDVNFIFIRSVSTPATPPTGPARVPQTPIRWYDNIEDVPDASPGDDESRIYSSFGQRPAHQNNWTWQQPRQTDGRDGQPGNRGLSGYSHSVVLTNYQTALGLVNTDEEWFFTGGTGNTWPASTGLTLVEADDNTKDEFRLTEVGSLLTIYKNTENWGDYRVRVAPTVMDSGQVVFTSLSIVENIGAPSFSSGDTGEIHFNPRGRPGEITDGPGSFTKEITGSAWSNSEANSAVMDGTASGRNPIDGDYVTLYNLTAKYVNTRRFNGTTWVEATQYFDGRNVFPGSLDINVARANVIIAESITADIQNYVPLWAGSLRVTRDSTGVPFTLSQAPSGFDELVVTCGTYGNNATKIGTCTFPVSEIRSNYTGYVAYIPPGRETSHGNDPLYFAVGLGSNHDDIVEFRLWPKTSKNIRIASRDNDIFIYQISGLKNPVSRPNTGTS